MKFGKKDKFLVVRFPDGKFLYLEKGVATTTPFHVDNPINATKKRPFFEDNSEEYFNNPKEPSYYFENSERMRSWLEGGKMVCFESETIAKEKK